MPAYVVGHLEIYDRETYQTYLYWFLPSFERHDGRLLATSMQMTATLEGTWAYPHTGMLEFRDMRKARLV